MISNSNFEYYFIRTCIIGLHYIAPLSILYCIAVIAIYGVKATKYPVPIIIETIALAETLFLVLAYLPYRAYLQREALHPPALSREERKELFDLCNENIPNPEAYLRKWFLGAPLADIKRENLKDFLLWAFFNRGGSPGTDDEELEEYCDATERLLGQKIEPGRGTAKCLRLTLDKVDMLHRSLIWYCCVGFVDLMTYMNLLRCGFDFHRIAASRFFTLFPFRPQTLLSTKRSPVKHLTYWHRKHTSKTKLPILFIHGIGIGLYPYVNFLAELNSADGLETGSPDDQVGIIVLEIMPVSFRITHSALSKSEMCAEIAVILAYHGWDKAVLVSHSYGTVIATHLLKNPKTAPLFGPLVLIDPVSVLLHLPDVAYNFTRRQPKRANEHQLYYFASMDMGVSHTLSRHFFWSENILWKKDIEDRNVTVSLSGQDLIVDTQAVGQYLATGFPASPKTSSAASSTVLIDMSDDGSSQRTNGNAITSESDKSVAVIEEAEHGMEAWKHKKWKGKGLDLLWFESLDHAQVFDKKTTRRLLVNAIRTYCQQGVPRSNGTIDSH